MSLFKYIVMEGNDVIQGFTTESAAKTFANNQATLYSRTYSVYERTFDYVFTATPNVTETPVP